MRIIKNEALSNSSGKTPGREGEPRSMVRSGRKANWKTPVEMKQVYRNADLVGGEPYSTRPAISTV